jgi:hypothetical protein
VYADTYFGCTHKKCCPDVLNEHDALELDDEEVDQLLSIVQEALQRLLGDDEVLLWSHPGCNAISKDCLACDLSSSSNTKDEI